MKRAAIAICGAGIAGIAAAYHLAAGHRQRHVVLVDGRQPLSFTTGCSGENYRDYWPQPCMAALMRDSIGMMEELAADSGNAIGLRATGYDFLSESADGRIFASTDPREPVAETDPEILRSNYPYLSDSIGQVLHIERAGSTDVHALGSLLLQRARASGAVLIKAEVAAIQRHSAGGFELDLCRGDTTEKLRVERVILAAGPFTGDLAGMLGFRLPVENFLQRKIVMPDPLGIVPRDIPFTVFADAQRLEWSDDERDLIAADPDYHWLLDEFPPGLHIKPDLPGRIKLGWAYNRTAEPPRWEHDADVDFPNVVIRGASRFVPGLKPYIDKLPTPVAQLAGYYSRTPENWPLIGPLDSQGAFTICALSGYGTMAACAAGALCAAWVTGSTLPGYARYFHPGRYSDPDIVAEMRQAVSDGQL